MRAVVASGFRVVTFIGAAGAAVALTFTLAGSGASGCAAFTPAEEPDAAAPRDGASPADAASTIDGSGPMPVIPACASGQVLCNGICIAGSDCTACSGAQFLCAPIRTCTNTCDVCTDTAGAKLPIECIACDGNQARPLGTCQPNDTSLYCQNGNYSTSLRGAGATHCNCSSGKVANCLGDNQVCQRSGDTDFCITCGEQGTPAGPTHGMLCKGGGTCNTAMNPPRCL